MTSRSSCLSHLAIRAVAGSLFVAGAAGAATEGPTLAYIDPGAGSFLLQALVAALAGIVVAVNAYWQKIRSFLGLSSNSEPSDAPRDSESSDD